MKLLPKNNTVNNGLFPALRFQFVRQSFFVLKLKPEARAATKGALDVHCFPVSG